MSRYKFNRIDGNEKAIADALIAAGCTVDHVARKPYDLVVGRAGVTYLLEVKNPARDLNKRRLTSAQQTFSAIWRGHWAKVETVDEALAVLRSIKQRGG